MAMAASPFNRKGQTTASALQTSFKGLVGLATAAIIDQVSILVILVPLYKYDMMTSADIYGELRYKGGSGEE